jgi:hypothetical protein
MWTWASWIIQFSNHGTYCCSTHLVINWNSNCIFLTNKYQQEYVAHGNKARALQRVITKVGTATLMTNLTTAAGFATFIITNRIIERVWYHILIKYSCPILFMSYYHSHLLQLSTCATRKAPETFESQLH